MDLGPMTVEEMKEAAPIAGMHTYGLDELAGAVRYRRFLHRLMRRYCGRRILEVGSGTGEFVKLFDPEVEVIATDVDPRCLGILEEVARGRPSMSVRHLDVTSDPAPDISVSTVLAINVLEHIEDDAAAAAAMAAMLDDDGRLVVFVPAHQALYGPFDAAVGHVRRYGEQTLRDTMARAGLEIEVLRPVNLIGGIAWWFAVKLGQRERPSARIVRIYDALLMPIVALLERHWTPPFGQSFLCVARRLPERG